MDAYSNPFDSILSEMNAAKVAYEQRMRDLQGQLGTVRQAMNTLSVPQRPISTAEPVPSTVPASIDQLTVLGEIKTLIARNNELLEQFIKPVTPTSKESTIKPINNENVKK